MQQTQPLAWGARVTPAFRARLFTLCDDFDWPEERASHLMAVIAFETGRTFSPTIRNPGSSAIGLIQFLGATAKYLGTSITALARLSAEGQLYYVQRYLHPFASRIHDLDDLYMAVLWPAAVGKASDSLLWRGGTPAFAANRGLDLDRNGRITKREAARRVHDHLAEGYRMDNVYRPTAPTARPAPEKKVSEFLL